MSPGDQAQAIALLAVAATGLREAGGSHARGVAEKIDDFIREIARQPAGVQHVIVQLDGRKIAAAVDRLGQEVR